ncbi:MAG: hypothetical protein Q7Q71_12205 [Verrucomicrobiota bacterium JB023]|nr:hypothetical protein [Verrucomicrobiota bacterium JB023]
MKSSLSIAVIVAAAALGVAYWQSSRPGTNGNETQPAGETLVLPLRVHLVTGLDMVREAENADGSPSATLMKMTLSKKEAEAIISQVNDLWAPARIYWETDPEQGGGGIIHEQAGGGNRSPEEIMTLAQRAVDRKRGSTFNYMAKVFPKLADPAQNESMDAGGVLHPGRARFYHLYLFPYVGQTLQGTANLPGTFAIVGTYSDKKPNQNGFPLPRPHLIPGDAEGRLLPDNFPAAGALSATIAHELGHNLSLRHADEGMPDNLMKGRVKIRLGPRQISKARQQALKGPRLR